MLNGQVLPERKGLFSFSKMHLVSPHYLTNTHTHPAQTTISQTFLPYPNPI